MPANENKWTLIQPILCLQKSESGHLKPKFGYSSCQNEIPFDPVDLGDNVKLPEVQGFRRITLQTDKDLNDDVQGHTIPLDAAEAVEVIKKYQEMGWKGFKENMDAFMKEDARYEGAKNIVLPVEVFLPEEFAQKGYIKEESKMEKEIADAAVAKDNGLQEADVLIRGLSLLLGQMRQNYGDYKRVLLSEVSKEALNEIHDWVGTEM
jgi:hypothetical protein